MEAHQPMEGSSVAHEGGRAPSSAQKSSESLQLQQRGDYNDDLPCRHRPALRVNPDLIGNTRDLLVGFDPIGSHYFDRLGFSRIRLAYGKHSQCERSSMSNLHDRSHKKAILSLLQVGVQRKHAQREDDKLFNNSTKTYINRQIAAISKQDSAHPGFKSNLHHLHFDGSR